MATTKQKTVTSLHASGSRVFILDDNTLHQTMAIANQLRAGSYFMVRSQLRRAVLEARMMSISCYYHCSSGETNFTVAFHYGTNIIRKIGCQYFGKVEGRKLSRWATYGKIKIGVLTGLGGSQV